MNNPNTWLKRFAFKSVEKQVRYIYKRCDKILISSKRFKEHVQKYGGDVNRVVFFPNWSDDMLKGEIKELNVALPDGFVVMMAGNLGDSQDLESVTNLILELRDIKELKWVFVGDGSKKQRLDTFIVEHQLDDTCFAVGRHPYPMMPSFFEKADAMLLSLKAASEQLDCVVPARLQAYMSAAKPVFAMIGNGGADVIKEANAGYCASPGDYKGLAEQIRAALQNRDELQRKGASGRRFFEQHFTKEKCIDHLCDIIG